ncbi:hypothetical protein HY495_00920 [Candidatus Woesearchaeota archaeon]|nr:hypothetical protein [Candidatus Woesearchaeota archaeon]
MLGISKDVSQSVDKFQARFYKVLKHSLKLKDEEILIISDYGQKENTMASMIGYGYYQAAQKKKHMVTLLHQDVKKGFMFADKHVVEAMGKLAKENVIILAVSNKLGRFAEENSFRTFCHKRGHRFLSATGLGDVKAQHFPLFLDAMQVNFRRMQKMGNRIKKKWDQAEEIRVRTAAGTDVTFDVSGKEAIANVGAYHAPGEGGNMPAGEVYIPPQGMHGVRGKIVIDGTLKTEAGAFLVDSPLTLHVRDGMVEEIEGKHALLLQKTFEKFEHRAKYPERIRRVGELAIGINPGAVLIGSTIIDEKVLGTGHIAIGSNHWFGGDIKTIYHGDQVFKKPVFYVDGKKMEL